MKSRPHIQFSKNVCFQTIFPNNFLLFTFFVSPNRSAPSSNPPRLGARGRQLGGLDDHGVAGGQGGDHGVDGDLVALWLSVVPKDFYVFGFWISLDIKHVGEKKDKNNLGKSE